MNLLTLAAVLLALLGKRNKSAPAPISEPECAPCDEAARRMGNPKTEEERRITHKARYGTDKLPQRGTGLHS